MLWGKIGQFQQCDLILVAKLLWQSYKKTAVDNGNWFNKFINFRYSET